MKKNKNVEVKVFARFLVEYVECVNKMKMIPFGEEVDERHLANVSDIKDACKVLGIADSSSNVYDVDRGGGTVELTAEDTTPIRYRFSYETGKLIKGWINTKAFLGKRIGKNGSFFPVFKRVPNVWESKNNLGGKIRLLTYASAMRLCKGDVRKLQLNFRPLASVLLFELRKNLREKERQERNSWQKDLIA